MKRVYELILRMLDSRVFFLAIMLLASLQGLWYAVSFQPILFDERAHLDFIYLYADNHWPIITEQKPQWDGLGDVTRENSYLFFYLMSIPLQVLRLITDNQAVQIISLRILSIAIFLIGLYLVKKIALGTNLSNRLSNLVVLLFILIPAVAPLAGVVTYDIAAFTLSMLMLLWAVQFLNSKEFDVKRFIGVVALAGFIGVVKYSAIALALPVVAFLLWIIISRYRKRSLNILKDSFMAIGNRTKVFLAIGLLLSVVIVVERPVSNLIVYGDVTPDCELIMSEERCYSNYVAKRNLEFAKHKSENFSPLNPITFFYMYWLPDMVKTSAQQWPGGQALPVVFVGLHAAALATIAFCLLNARKLRLSKVYLLLIFVCIFYTLTLFAQQYGSYVKLGQPVALSGRYLLPIIPLVIILLIVSCRDVLRLSYMRAVSVIGGTVILVFAIQGGGIITHALSVDDQNYYWHNHKVIEINQSAQALLRGIVLEH